MGGSGSKLLCIMKQLLGTCRKRRFLLLLSWLSKGEGFFLRLL